MFEGVLETLTCDQLPDLRPRQQGRLSLGRPGAISKPAGSHLWKEPVPAVVLVGRQLALARHAIERLALQQPQDEVDPSLRTPPLSGLMPGADGRRRCPAGPPPPVLSQSSQRNVEHRVTLVKPSLAVNETLGLRGVRSGVHTSQVLARPTVTSGSCTRGSDLRAGNDQPGDKCDAERDRPDQP